MTGLAERAGNGARAATLADAVAFSDVLLLATPWPTTKEVLDGLGPLAGKVLIDATNPLLPGLAGLEVGTTVSGAEMVSCWAPGAWVVKAFNTVGSNVMENPSFGGVRPVLFFCGDDAKAKETVGRLAEAIGFDAKDAGPLRQARSLEPFALLWISLALEQGHGREIAFQFLKR